MRIVLSKKQLEMFLEDCEAALQSCHYGGPICSEEDLTACPWHHFDEPADEVRLRQETIRKLERRLENECANA